MNLGQVLGGALIFLGTFLGSTLLNITGAVIGPPIFLEVIGIYSGICFLTGVVTFWSNWKKQELGGKKELGRIKIFSEKN